MNSKIESTRIIYDERGYEWGLIVKGKNGCKLYHLKVLKDAREEHFEELLPTIAAL